MKFRKKGFDYSLLKEALFPPEKIQPIKWGEIFKNTNPLIVEIGCGNGHFLTEEASNQKQNNFVGIDRKDYRIVKCRMKELVLQLSNIRWICGEAFSALERMFFDQSISKIYMAFPDPWPKKRHHKHRLFQENFIALLDQKLAPEGQFVFISDHEEYYRWCIELLQYQTKFKIIQDTYDHRLTESAFGKIWKKEERSFYSFTLEKFYN